VVVNTVEVVEVMPSRTTTSLVIMVIKETQTVRMARMTRATTLALFQKTQTKLKAAINPVEEAIVVDVEAVVSSLEDTVITIAVVIMAITKRVAVSLIMEEVVTVSIKMITEVESRLQLREITIRNRRRWKILLMEETISMRIL
jgi:hypothetical protein